MTQISHPPLARHYSSLGTPLLKCPKNCSVLFSFVQFASAARRGLTAGWAFFAGPVTVCLVKMLAIAMLFGAVVPFEVFAGGDAAWQVTRIEPGQSVDYYREFNASSRKEVEEQARREAGMYLVVSLDGQMPVTDGQRVETLSCVWESGRGSAGTDLAIPLPLKWKQLPDGARVVSSTPPARALSETAEIFATRIKPSLPTGWSVTREQNTVTIKRDHPVEWYGTISCRPTGTRPNSRPGDSSVKALTPSNLSSLRR